MRFSVDLDELRNAAQRVSHLHDDLVSSGSELSRLSGQQDAPEDTDDEEDQSELAKFDEAVGSSTEASQLALTEATATLTSLHDKLLATVKAYENTEDRNVQLILDTLQIPLEEGQRW